MCSVQLMRCVLWGDIRADSLLFAAGERNSGASTIDYPMGGSGAIVDALVRGIERLGGRVLLRTHVDRVRTQSRIQSLIQPYRHSIAHWTPHKLCDACLCHTALTSR